MGCFGGWTVPHYIPTRSPNPTIPRLHPKNLREFHTLNMATLQSCELLGTLKQPLKMFAGIPIFVISYPQFKKLLLFSIFLSCSSSRYLREVSIILPLSILDITTPQGHPLSFIIGSDPKSYTTWVLLILITCPFPGVQCGIVWLDWVGVFLDI